MQAWKPFVSAIDEEINNPKEINWFLYYVDSIDLILFDIIKGPIQ